MRRLLLPTLLATLVLLAFLFTLGFLWWGSREAPVEVETLEVSTGDVVQKTVATGAIVPRNEVTIQPRISGIIDAIHVRPGQEVAAGDLIATIRVVPNSVSLADARADVDRARIARENAQRELERVRGLHGQGVVSLADLQQSEVSEQLRTQEHEAAVTRLQLVQEGATRGAGGVNTEVRSTVAGMVLSVDVEVGASVIETNTFNSGTTIAYVADMSDVIFEGEVDEAEVGKLQPGMPLVITVGALDDQTFDGTLETIAPKGVLRDGAVQFGIEAAVDRDDAFIRAGSSANADIVLDRREEVLTLDESALGFEGGQPYVEVEVSPGTFERRPIEIGLSDGLQVEVLSGLAVGQRVRKAPP